MVISRKQFFIVTRKNVSNLYNKGGNCLQLLLGANPTDIGDKIFSVQCHVHTKAALIFGCEFN